jgi:predicted RNA-binding protein YlxR (DUF448 family)
VRLTRSAVGIVVGGASDGRGAWLCRDTSTADPVVASCLETALARRAFARAWKRDVGVEDEQKIRELVGRRVDHGEHPDAR